MVRYIIDRSRNPAYHPNQQTDISVRSFRDNRTNKLSVISITKQCQLADESGLLQVQMTELHVVRGTVPLSAPLIKINK